MATSSRHPRSVWALARAQHGLITRGQLLGLGYSPAAIRHRLDRGRLHRVRRRVYAVGSPQLGDEATWLAAVLSCGHEALLSDWSALFLWAIDGRRPSHIQVVISSTNSLRQPGVVVHRRFDLLPRDRSEHRGIPVTSPVRALFDVAPGLEEKRLESLAGEADKLGLICPADLRREAELRRGQHGAGAIRAMIERNSFSRTDSELERRFLRILRGTSLPTPETQVVVEGFRVDFMWPGLGLVVETDGLRYHRTEMQQRSDRQRDRVLAARGLAVLRFTHFEVVHQPERVRDELERVALLRQGPSAA